MRKTQIVHLGYELREIAKSRGVPAERVLVIKCSNCGVIGHASTAFDSWLGHFDECQLADAAPQFFTDAEPLPIPPKCRNARRPDKRIRLDKPLPKPKE